MRVGLGNLNILYGPVAALFGMAAGFFVAIMIISAHIWWEKGPPWWLDLMGVVFAGFGLFSLLAFVVMVKNMIRDLNGGHEKLPGTVRRKWVKRYEPVAHLCLALNSLAGTAFRSRGDTLPLLCLVA